MKTPEERAKEIVDRTHTYNCDRQWLGDSIAAAIREAVTEALVKAESICGEQWVLSQSQTALRIGERIAEIRRAVEKGDAP